MAKDFIISNSDIVNYNIYMKRSTETEYKKVYLSALSHNSITTRNPVFGAGSRFFQGVEENVKLVGGVLLEPALKSSPLEDFIINTLGHYENIENVGPVDIYIVNKFDKEDGMKIYEAYFKETQGTWDINSVGKVHKMEYFAKVAYTLKELANEFDLDGLKLITGGTMV